MKTRLLIFTITLFLSFLICSADETWSYDAEQVLKKYLAVRKESKFRDCCKFFSVEFRKRFDCPNWFTESEMYFKESKIMNSGDGSLNRFRVETTIEDPTSDPIHIKAIENYYLIVEKGKWKIDNWSIEYK